MSRFVALSLAAALALLAGVPIRAQDAARPEVHKARAGANPTGSAVHPGDRDCLRSTDSLIPPRPGECLPVSGRSYGREDIRRTGARTTAEALQMLDPGVTVRGH